MRLAAVLLLALTALLALLSASAAPNFSNPVGTATPPPRPGGTSVRRRREGEVNVDVDQAPGQDARLTVSGQANVWKDSEERHRVDVRAAADSFGNRRAGVSYKW